MSTIVTFLQQFAIGLFGGTIQNGSTSEEITGIIPQFFNWVTSDTVLPWFGIGICVSLVLLAVKVVRGTIWGV